MASVWVHERQHTGQAMSQLMAALRKRFNKAPHEGRQCWIGKNERSLLEMLKTGSGVGERQRAWERAAVSASIERSPMKSTRKRSSELGVPR